MLRWRIDIRSFLSAASWLLQLIPKHLERLSNRWAGAFRKASLIPRIVTRRLGRDRIRLWRQCIAKREIRRLEIPRHLNMRHIQTIANLVVPRHRSVFGKKVSDF